MKHYKKEKSCEETFSFIAKSLSINYVNDFLMEEFQLSVNFISQDEKMEIEELLRFLILQGINDIKLLYDIVNSKKFEEYLKCSNDLFKNYKKKTTNISLLQNIKETKNYEEKILIYHNLINIKKNLQQKNLQEQNTNKKIKEFHLQNIEKNFIQKNIPHSKIFLFWTPNMRKDIRKDVKKEIEKRFNIIIEDKEILLNQKLEELKISIKEITFKIFWKRFEEKKKFIK